MFAILGLLACSRPPPAPEGLTDSLRMLLREFHADDDTVSAALTGLMDWFDDEGGELLDAKADLYNVGSFQLELLEPDDIARLPTEHDPDPSLAPGVVSLAEMACKLPRAEGLLVRPDQDVVFEGTWKTYSRDFVTSRGEYEGTDYDAVGAIREEIPEEAIDQHPDGLLLTMNHASASKFGFEMEFDLDERLRHGTFDVQGEPTDAVLVLSFWPHAADAGGGNSIVQAWAIEVDLARPGGKTLRVFGAWSQLESSLIEADSALVLTTGVNEAQGTAERMSGICAGEIDIPPE